MKSCTFWDGHVIAQTVSRRLPTAVIRVRSQVRPCWICGGQSTTGAGFLRLLCFPLSIHIPPIAPYSSLSITRGWYSRPNSGRYIKWTQSHSTLKIFWVITSCNLVKVRNLLAAYSMLVSCLAYS
jgi:hypothetical protein